MEGASKFNDQRNGICPRCESVLTYDNRRIKAIRRGDGVTEWFCCESCFYNSGRNYFINVLGLNRQPDLNISDVIEHEIDRAAMSKVKTKDEPQERGEFFFTTYTASPSPHKPRSGDIFQYDRPRNFDYSNENQGAAAQPKPEPVGSAGPSPMSEPVVVEAGAQSEPTGASASSNVVSPPREGEIEFVQHKTPRGALNQKFADADAAGDVIDVDVESPSASPPKKRVKMEKDDKSGGSKRRKRRKTKKKRKRKTKRRKKRTIRKTKNKKKRTQTGGTYVWVDYATFYNYLERLDSAALKVNPEDTKHSFGNYYTYKYINNGQEQTKILGYREARNDNTYRFDFWMNDNLTRIFDSRNGENVVFKIPSHESPQPGGGKKRRKKRKSSKRTKRRKKRTIRKTKSKKNGGFLKFRK